MAQNPIVTIEMENGDISGNCTKYREQFYQPDQ